MRVLVVGAGGVGSAITSIAARSGSFEHVVVADVDLRRAERAAERAGGRTSPARVDVRAASDVVQLVAATRADVIVNACDPRMNPPIFDGAFTAGCHYLDMAMDLSHPHPTRPHELPGVMLGAAQLAASERWAEQGTLAVVGMGVEPGLSDVLARYADDHLFAQIDEIGVRDGNDLVIDGLDFAPTFSIWTTIEECLNPPLMYERARGFFTTAPFSEPETFSFPDGIGPRTCVNVEHEEVILMARWLSPGRITFKYGLSDAFIDVLTTLHTLGLDSTDPVDVHGQLVAPRDVVAAVLPNPAELGDRMHGRTCAGTWVRGRTYDGTPREVFLYQVVDNDWAMRTWGHHAVVWQTAVHAVTALEMLASHEWRGVGVLGPEAFPADPFLDRLWAHGASWTLDERASSAA